MTEELQRKLEKADGFVLDLTTEEQVEMVFNELFNKDNTNIENKRKAILSYYTNTYNIVLCKGYNVFQVLERQEDLHTFSIENRCRKISLDCGGYFYVERFEKEHDNLFLPLREEEERAKIYDETGGYLDYISCESIETKDYEDIITHLQQSQSAVEFLGKLDIDEEMIIANSLQQVLTDFATSLDDGFEESEILERIKDKNWTEKDLMERYEIQKVGNCYFKILC